jgi:cytochrome c oxidase cbb3-type subunit 4
MDLNTLRSLATVSAFLAFLAIVVWAMAGRRKADFDAAAQLPLADDPPAQSAQGALGDKQ